MGYLIREEPVEDVDVRVVARRVPCLGHGQFRGQDADVFALLCDHLAVCGAQMNGHQNDKKVSRALLDVAPRPEA